MGIIFLLVAYVHDKTSVLHPLLRKELRRSRKPPSAPHGASRRRRTVARLDELLVQQVTADHYSEKQKSRRQFWFWAWWPGFFFGGGVWTRAIFVGGGADVRRRIGIFFHRLVDQRMVWHLYPSQFHEVLEDGAFMF